MPPEERRALLWLKLLLYLVTDAGFGELEADSATECSEAIDPVRLPARVGPLPGKTPSSVKEPRVGIRACVLGEPANGDAPSGDADNGGALNG